MLKMLRIVSVEQGYDPRDFCLIPSGGSGPVHAVELAEELGIREVIVPPAPGLLSSQGLLSADIRYDFRPNLCRIRGPSRVVHSCSAGGRSTGRRRAGTVQLQNADGADRCVNICRHALSRPGLRD